MVEQTKAEIQSVLDKGDTAFAPDWVVGLGGGAALDLGKALAALILAPGGPLDHLEVVGRALRRQSYTLNADGALVEETVFAPTGDGPT